MICGPQHKVFEHRTKTRLWLTKTGTYPFTTPVLLVSYDPWMSWILPLCFTPSHIWNCDKIVSHDLAGAFIGYSRGLREKKVRVMNNYSNGTTKAIRTRSGTHINFVCFNWTIFDKHRHLQQQISTSKFPTIWNNQKSFTFPKRSYMNSISFSESFFKKHFITCLKQAKI